MVWTRKAKIDYLVKRRRHAVAHVKTLAKTLDMTPRQTKSLVKKMRKTFSKKYAARRDSLKETNKLQRKIEKIESKPSLTKTQTRELKKLKKLHGKKLIQTHAKWNKFMESVGYLTQGEEDERNAKAGSG